MRRGGSQQVVTDADKPQSMWNWSIHGMACFQDIDDMDESVGNIITSFEQVSMPFIRVDTVAGMAIHSWEDFRRLVRWGSDTHRIDDAADTSSAVSLCQPFGEHLRKPAPAASCAAERNEKDVMIGTTHTVIAFEDG